jgi:hypothetical protein
MTGPNEFEKGSRNGLIEGIKPKIFLQVLKKTMK